MNPAADIDPGDIHPITPDALMQAARAIKAGGLVVYPTHDVYGLGADAADAGAIERIFAIKERPADRPILVLIDQLSRLDGLATHVPPAAKILIERFWPGHVTLVLPARASLPPDLTGHSGKIGVRLAGHPVARALVRSVGRPITGTSANPSGGAGVAAIGRMPPEFIRRVDVVLDAGVLAGGPGSTVVDVTGRCVQVVREGRIATGEIMRCVAGTEGLS